MQEDPSLSLRLFVDKEKNNKVVVAEASSEFVDILLSFLTLPLGTIIRLVSPDIGCINNLYQSVKNSGSQVSWLEVLNVNISKNVTDEYQLFSQDAN